MVAIDKAGQIGGAAPLFGFGGEPMAAGIALQKELLEAYEKASSAWLDRIKTEMKMWSELADKLRSARNLPEALEGYTNCVAQGMQMAAEDGQHMLNDCQQITQKIAK